MVLFLDILLDVVFTNYCVARVTCLVMIIIVAIIVIVILIMNLFFQHSIT